VARLATLQAGRRRATRTLTAALADITNSDLPLFQRPAGAIPQQLWANVGYTRRFVPLLTPKPLTSYKFGGWEFTQRPRSVTGPGTRPRSPPTRWPPGDRGHRAADRRRLGHRPEVPGLRGHRVLDGVLRRADRVLRPQTDQKAAAAIVAAAQDVTGTDPVARLHPPGRVRHGRRRPTT
jgi:hypothetical protein